MSFDARHDVQNLGLSYGTALLKKGATIRSDFNSFESQTPGMDIRIFLEKRFTSGLVARAFWGNILQPNLTRNKILYKDSQSSGTVITNEARNQKLGAYFGFRVRNTF
jgi:hypothetical protein